MLVPQLVFQVKLAPYLEAKLDVVSGALHNLLRGSNGLRMAGRSDSDGRAGAFDVVWHGLLSAFPARSFTTRASLGFHTRAM